MANELRADLVARLRERAQDPARRSDTAAREGSTVSFEEALAGVGPVAELSDDVRRELDAYVASVNSPFGGLMSELTHGDGTRAQDLLAALGSVAGGKQVFAATGDGDVVSCGPATEPSVAPPPASEDDVAAAEARLGFALPGELRQFYLEVADGGVGPGDGLYGLDELAAKYREMTSEPVGPQGQPWPAELLPLSGADWDLVCLHRQSGRLVFWDLDELDDDEELPPDQPTWPASFVPEADSLAAWLGVWAPAGS